MLANVEVHVYQAFIKMMSIKHVPYVIRHVLLALEEEITIARFAEIS
jgi:hypothetical protein